MKKNERIHRTGRIEKKLDENVVAYCSQNHISYNKAINEGLKLLTKTKMIEDNLPEILRRRPHLTGQAFSCVGFATTQKPSLLCFVPVVLRPLVLP